MQSLPVVFLKFWKVGVLFDFLKMEWLTLKKITRTKLLKFWGWNDGTATAEPTGLSIFQATNNRTKIFNRTHEPYLQLIEVCLLGSGRPLCRAVVGAPRPPAALAPQGRGPAAPARRGGGAPAPCYRGRRGWLWLLVAGRCSQGPQKPEGGDKWRGSEGGWVNRIRVQIPLRL